MTQNMRTLLVLSALLSPALAKTTLAADWQVIQTGENFDGVWSGEQRNNMVGGGTARIMGGSDNAEIAYSGQVQTGSPIIATLSGGGDDVVLAYAVPAETPVSTSPTMAAQRMVPLFVANASRR